MDPVHLHRRAEIARLLRAARWLRGSLVPTHDRVAQRSARTLEPVGWKIAALPADELAAREPLRSNWWTGNRIMRIERLEHDASPVELDLLERALSLPGLFDGVVPGGLPAALTPSAPGHATSAVRLPRLGSRPAGDHSSVDS